MRFGSIGAQEVARSAPDGYTLLMGTNTTQAANVSMLKNLPYDPARDFAPIIRIVTTAMVLVVRSDFPARDLPQFMEYARAHPHITAGYGSGGIANIDRTITIARRPVGHRGLLSLACRRP